MAISAVCDCGFGQQAIKHDAVQKLQEWRLGADFSDSLIIVKDVLTTH